MSSIPSSSTQEVEMIALKAELESTQEELKIAKEKLPDTEERRYIFNVANKCIANEQFSCSVATDLCYASDGNDDTVVPKMAECRISKYLSDYMLYLLVFCPSMLQEGIAEIRYRDTLAKCKRFFQEEKIRYWKFVLKRKQSIEKTEACKKLLGVKFGDEQEHIKGDQSQSVLFYGCRLAKQLQDLETQAGWTRKQKWEMISEVWVEMLTYAANKCIWKEHGQQLRRGGELLTHVRLLMAHLGLSEQYRIQKQFISEKLDRNFQCCSWLRAPYNILCRLLRYFTGNLSLSCADEEFLRFVDRLLVLRSSSTQHFRDSLPLSPDPCEEFVTLIEQETPEGSPERSKRFMVVVQDDIDPKDCYLVQAYFCFKRFKYHFANLLLDYKEQEYIYSTIKDKTAVDAFKMVAVELGFMYDVFYTKDTIVYSQFLSWESFSVASASFALFLLVILHIATDLLYYGDLDVIIEGDVSKLNPKCKVSKYLSDYMLYLLVFCPYMLPQGFGLIRYKEAFAEAISIFKKKRPDDILNESKACKDLLEKQFQDMTDIHRRRKWEVISDVWVEMLAFAAHNCGWKEYVQQLRKDGELLTHVYLLWHILAFVENIPVVN
ncbi:hypothetical protein EZV62_003283 [Acer yangbiense]|uniref:DUF4220 domain-containing protein n=1 Tax=Acer yangbiense TaxID=1000413 RepID=A0A5C7IH02_9ROSI|nr:hypothetical protein EZV62_003283 [Acer yangbiense]